MNPGPPGERAPSPVEVLCGWIALAVPLAVTVSRAGFGGQWREDLALVRDLGMVPASTEGLLSMALVQVSALVPLGGRVMRAALVSAVCLSVASRVAYALGLRLLHRVAPSTALGPALALGAALTATLSQPFQLEGTAVGGAPLAVALGLGYLMVEGRPSSLRVWALRGSLLGLTAVQSHVAGAALLVVAMVQPFVEGGLPSRRGVTLFVGCAAACVGFALMPAILRPYAARSVHALDLSLTLGLDAGLVTLGRMNSVDAWFAEVGLITAGLALGGLGFGLSLKRTRPLVAPLLLLVFVDFLLPSTPDDALAADPHVSTRLLALAALGLGAALGVYSSARALFAEKIPMARAAAVMLVVFNFTLVLVTSEQSGKTARTREQLAADVWTAEALGELPRDSLLLVRSRAVTWRLWAARVLRHERPDVVVVPMPMLARGSVARDLLALEPLLAPLIREVSVSGRPNEFALSTLADARPLFVELDTKWEPRLMDHLSPQPMWLGFAAHALGRSDRKRDLERGRTSFRRVLQAARSTDSSDPATLAILGLRAREQALTLAALGDRDNVAAVMRDLRRIDPHDPFLGALSARLEQDSRGRVDVLDLID